MRLGTWIGIGLIAIAGVGCGGGGSKGGGGSYNAVMASFAHPTGTLAATNAVAVAQAYQTSQTSGLGTAAGERLDQKSSPISGSMACPAGGTETYDLEEASASAISESWTYANCCSSAGCCYNGSGDLFYSAAGTTATAFCESFQLTGTCQSLPVNANYSICEDGTTGTINYLVQVGGQTFAVSGSYSAGYGTLTITDMNGTFTCSYSADHGSCSGGVGVTFTY